MRILCDSLTLIGFLAKPDEHYELAPDSAVFLSRELPAHVGGTIELLHSPGIRGTSERFTAAVRNGGAAQSEPGAHEQEHPVWIAFPRSVGPLMMSAAGGLAEFMALDPNRPAKIRDSSASHSIWDIGVAKK